MKTKILIAITVLIAPLGTAAQGELKIAYADTSNSLNVYNFNQSTTTLDTSNTAQGFGESLDTDYNGAANIWYDDGSNLIQYETGEELNNDTGINIDTVGGAGDLNNDGDHDVLFIDSSNNINVYDLGDGTTSDQGQDGEAAGPIADANNDGDNDIIFVDTNDNLKYEDDATTTDTGEDVSLGRLGGVADIDDDGDLDIAYRDTSQQLAWYDFGSGSKTSTSINADFVGGIRQIDGSNGKDVVFIDDNNNLKYVDTDTLSVTDTQVQANQIGKYVFKEYNRPDISASTNRTEYDNSIQSGKSIELLNNFTTAGETNNVTLATRPDTKSSYTNHTGIYDSPLSLNQTGKIEANYTYKNSTLPNETEVFWRIWINEDNPNQRNGVLYTASSKDNDTTKFEIEKNPIELFSTSPDQQDASLSDPIPFQETPYAENPTEFDYSNVEVKEKLIDTAQANTIELFDPNGVQIGFDFNRTSNETVWNISSIESGETLPYTLNYDIQALTVDTRVYNRTTNTGDENVKEINVTNPNPVDIEDVNAETDFPFPKATVSSNFFETRSGTRSNIDNDDDYGVEREDDNLDGLTDKLTWIIPSIDQKGNSEDNLTYELISQTGEPINVDREDVITNKPVQPVKDIQWRIGFRLKNDNPFAVDFERKIRVPQGSDSFAIDDNNANVREDVLGRYILLEETVPALSNETKFLYYETDSIAVNVDKDSPDKFIAGEPADAQIELRAQNLAKKNLTNASVQLDVDYAEDITVKDQRLGTNTDSLDSVAGDFNAKLGKIDKGVTKDYLVEYKIPTAQVTRIRKGSSDEGNNLTVYRVASEADRPINPVFFRETNIDCANVENVSVSGANITDENERNTTSNWECGNPVGSTYIPLGTITPNQELRIGIEHRKFDPEIRVPNIEIAMVIAFFKWISVGAILILLYTIYVNRSKVRQRA